jgi:peroxiredoxin
MDWFFQLLRRTKTMSKVPIGHDAPLFTLPLASGASLSLADTLQKGPAVLAFFKVSCPVCQFTFPFLERIHQAYGNERISVLGLSQDNSRDTRQFCQEYGLTFPMLIDQEGYPASNQYGLTNVPTVILISPEGKVKVSSEGFSKKDLEQISVELGKHLGRPPATVFRAGEAVPDYKPG